MSQRSQRPTVPRANLNDTADEDDGDQVPATTGTSSRKRKAASQRAATEGLRTSNSAQSQPSQARKAAPSRHSAPPAPQHPAAKLQPRPRPKKTNTGGVPEDFMPSQRGEGIYQAYVNQHAVPEDDEDEEEEEEARNDAEEEEEEEGEEVEQARASDEQDSGPDEDEDLDVGGTQFEAAFELTVSCFVTTL